jgi:uncharacterized integral membrane protein
MMRRIIRALVLIPLAVAIIAVAVANRRTVTISFDPFEPSDPALSITLPLYALILLLVIAGVVVGGIAAWLRQSKWRARARAAEFQLRALRAENERLKREAADGRALPPPVTRPSVEHARRLSIPPPVGRLPRGA